MNTGGTPKISKAKLMEFAKVFENSQLAIELKEKIANPSDLRVTDALNQSGASGFSGQGRYAYLKDPYASSFYTQLSVLMWRNAVNWRRDYQAICVQVAVSIVSAIILGTIFSETSGDCEIEYDLSDLPIPDIPNLPGGNFPDIPGMPDTSASECPSKDLNLNSLLFIIPVNLMLYSFQSIGKIIEEQKLFARERASGTYRTSAFLLSRILVEAPIFSLQAVAYGLSLYFFTDLKPGMDHVVFFLFTLVVTVNISYAFCNFFGSISPNLTVALNAGNGVYGLGVLFAGFYITYESMPNYYKPFYFLSVFRWPCGALILDQFGEGSFVANFNGLPAYKGETKWLDNLMGIVIVMLWHLGTFAAMSYQTRRGKILPEKMSAANPIMIEDLNIEINDEDDDDDAKPDLKKLPSRGFSGGSKKKYERLNNSNAFQIEACDENDTKKMKGKSNSNNLRTFSRKSTGYNDNLIPLRVKVTDVSFDINGKSLLTGVNAVFEQGQLMAIMGPSDAGKTTILDIIASRKSSGTISGKVFYNGQEREKLGASFTRILGYVPQDSHCIETLTVRETLMFTAELRLPSSFTHTQRDEICGDIEAQLGLQKVSGSRVGDELNRGISGGEMKRLSIGVELVTGPSLLILDEATSGLSAADAFSVVRLLRKLASNGHAVVMSIHQPRSNIFQLFDLLLLMRRGETVYFGSAKRCSDYFHVIGFPTPPGQSYSDHFLDVMSGDREQVHKLVNNFRVSQHWKEVEHSIMDSEDPMRYELTVLRDMLILLLWCTVWSIFAPRLISPSTLPCMHPFQCFANYSAAAQASLPGAAVCAHHMGTDQNPDAQNASALYARALTLRVFHRARRGFCHFDGQFVVACRLQHLQRQGVAPYEFEPVAPL
jgi:ABC-type multidrug transport system ATPase subunit